MKKTTIILSAVITSAIVFPTVANARNNYPVFPTRPADMDFNALSEDEQQAYLEEVEAYRTALCMAYQNDEYDWDFNLDGKTNSLDTLYLSHYYAELSTDVKEKSFYEKTPDGVIYYDFNDNMRAKISENGDLDGDGFINLKDGTQMLIALYSTEKHGDVNTDGKLDAKDASDMLKFYSNNSVSIQSDYVTEKNMEYLGDLNGDGKVDSSDASYALAEYSKLATE